MVYSDSSGKLGIVEEIDALCDTDSTSYPIAQKTRRVNQAYERIVGKLIARNGQWEFDDSNYSSFPIGVATLVQGQEDYTFDTTHLVIERAQVKDTEGLWHLLNPIDRRNIGVAIEEYQKTAGMPMEYDKSGSSIILKPAPSSTSVTLASGLRVYFQRTASVFTVADTTKQPGFPSPYHIILAYEGALPYCMTYKKDRVTLFRAERDKLEKELFEFMANTEKDVRNYITMGGINFR